MGHPSLATGYSARRRVLVLYDPYSLATNFVRDHLDGFRQFLPHDVWYAGATFDAPVRFELSDFDVVVVHFTVRVALGGHLSAAFRRALKRFHGLKILFIQDEYDAPLLAARWARDAGVRVLFTCVPEADRESFYPRAVIGDMTMVGNMTGYVSPRLATWPAARPLTDRPIVFGYRGRELPIRYGRLAREKLTIGVRMRAECAARRVPHDIEWAEDRRLSRDDWYAFLSNTRVMLGTESGSNVVDPDGSLQRTLARQPGLSFEAAFDRYLRPHDGRVRMNQVPPKLFEAVALRTALVLFEGEYSGVVRPDEHFIPLRKDFSNVDEVFARVADTPALEAMAERAHGDVIKSGRYSYSVLMALLDQQITAHAPPAGGRPCPWAAGKVGHPLPHRDPIPLAHVVRPLLHGRARRYWTALPPWVRRPVRLVARPPFALAVRAVEWAVRRVKRPGAA